MTNIELAALVETLKQQLEAQAANLDAFRSAYNDGEATTAKNLMLIESNVNVKLADFEKRIASMAPVELAAQTITALVVEAPKPLEVGDFVRVIAGDWGGNTGVISEIAGVDVSILINGWQEAKTVLDNLELTS